METVVFSTIYRAMGNQASNGKSVIVVGGGYGGTVAARELEQAGFDVTVIEAQDSMHHRFASLRSIVVPGWEHRSRIPLDKLLKRGKIVRGEVKSVDASGVILSNDTKIEADYVILAHGRRWSFPAAPVSYSDASSAVIEQMKAKQQLIRDANHVLIVGGGPVGVELAGEIAAQYPGKKISLVHSGETLLNNTTPPLHPRVAELALEKLRAMQVDVTLNKRVIGLPNPLPADSFITSSATYSLSDGAQISADLAIVTTGSHPHSHTLITPVNEANQVKVDELLRVEGYNNVYCVGDANNVSETKMGYAAEQQAIRASHNIIRKEAGKQEKAYVPAGGQTKYGIMMVPIGPNGGVAGIGETILDDFMTATIKSKGLFVKKAFAGRNAVVPQLN